MPRTYNNQHIRRHGCRKLRIYDLYHDMLKRCSSKTGKNKEFYADKNIKICEEWNNPYSGFVNFKDWAYKNGYRDDLSLDRINVKGNYCPENCRWVNQSIQVFNTNIRTDNSSGVTGVKRGFRDGKWVSDISFDKKRISLGIFNDINSAISARKNAEFILMNNYIKSIKNEGEILNKETYIITSESCGIGHPDKSCDYIADSFLDEALSQDINAQMAVECAIKDDLLMIYGEATTTAKIDYENIAKKCLKEIGYENEFTVIKKISEQSPQINKATISAEICANDQGIMYGYATNETPEYMPLPIILAHKIVKKYSEYISTDYRFKNDVKSQVSVIYNKNNYPIGIDTILLSASHLEEIPLEEIQKTLKTKVIDEVMSVYKCLDTSKANYIINPSGMFTIWGSFSDSGCVGRKIVVDTYGGVGRIGGGCFSSKNATKVDRSGAYYARFVAKNIVANNLAEKCEIQISYGIGIKNPISININCFNTEIIPIDKIYEIVKNNFDFSVGNIINELELLKPIYKKTSCYGHFGRDEFSWEKIKELK